MFRFKRRKKCALTHTKTIIIKKNSSRQLYNRRIWPSLRLLFDIRTVHISTAIHRVNVFCDLIPKYVCCVCAVCVCVLCTYFCLCFVLSTGLWVYSPGHWSVTQFARQLKQKHFVSHKYYFCSDIKSTLAIIDLGFCVCACAGV